MITAGLVKSETLSLVLLPIWLVCCGSTVFDNRMMWVQLHSYILPFYNPLHASAASSHMPKFRYLLFTDGGKNAGLRCRYSCIGVRGCGRVDVPAHPLLYMLFLPQGQSWVSVLIGFREERRASRLQAEEKSSTRHMDGLWDKWPLGTDMQKAPVPPRWVQDVHAERLSLVVFWLLLLLSISLWMFVSLCGCFVFRCLIFTASAVILFLFVVAVFVFTWRHVLRLMIVLCLFVVILSALWLLCVF